MLDQGETVGHPGDEIANPAGAFPFALAFGALDPFGRQVPRRGLVAREQVEQDPFRLAHHPHDAVVAVHVLFQERLDRGLLLRNRGRKRDQRLMVVADVMRRLRFRCRKPPARLRHDRYDHVGNQLAHQFRAAPGMVKIGIMPVDFGDDRGRERHHLEVIDTE